ncbi:hypothetical protein [Occallatibacter riparius]|uniref:HNH endonuclease n=1 Tax=Occallatibacter riparius TaxID=1002689 RepID=A0A9J7BW66_9BACT|nr:hypothetical protein [Occallatibacter riparius]UWZ85253.1 hypothetical protein MOP44_04755 [Occallatibacter riparius]
MMDEEGNFVGEICHIEAAKTGGERFRAAMTDEERRSFDNLLLLCHRHHVVTNNVHKFSVSKLKEMKAAHERKFSQIEEKMNATITDHSLESEAAEATTLIGILGTPDEHRPGEVKRMRKYASRVRELPIETRRLLSIAVRRAYEKATREHDLGGLGSATVNPFEVQKATGLTDDEIREQVRILSDHKLASVDDDEGIGRWTMYIYGEGHWSRLPEDIAGFCKAQGISLDEIFVNLRFDLLDLKGE